MSAQSLAELHQLLKDPSTDTELRTLAAEEVQSTAKSLDEISGHLQTSLVPAHPFAGLPCIIEIRPGIGGSEAALFVGDLLRMYQIFCRRHGLHYNILKFDGTPDHEVQEVILEVEGAGTYDLLRCEAGVHRVQRVPATENKGRTHTSVASVFVLPSFPNNGSEDLGANSFDNPLSDYFVDPKDVRTDVMRAKGAGGQHVNTTDSAVRLTHIPTNTVVSIQDSRSQPKNREKAWRILRARLAQARREVREEEMAQLRVSLVGATKTGRSDKIRTYNWSQQRVTDHRSSLTLNQLEDIIEGGESLDKLMDSVKVWIKDRDAKAFFADHDALAAKSDTKSK